MPLDTDVILRIFLNNFDYFIPTEILFGRGQIKNLGRKLRDFDRILFVWGGGSIKKNNIYEKIISQLGNKTYFELSGIKPNPRLSIVKKGIKLVSYKDLSEKE